MRIPCSSFPTLGTDGHDTGDLTDEAGGRGWNLSAEDLQKFLTTLHYSNDILFPATRGLMNEQYLGWSDNGTWQNQPFGSYLGHNGLNAGATLSYPQNANSSPHRVNTAIVQFPNDVSATLLMNSQMGAELAHPFTLMANSYANAWPVLVIDADASNNTFQIRQNESDSESIDIVLDGSTFLTLKSQSLNSLTLRGGDGNDTFDIEYLPDDISLTLDGGTGKDSFILGAGSEFGNVVQGNLTLIGGSDDDDLTIDDSNGIGEGYSISANSITAPSYPGTLVFSSIEDVDLTTNVEDNTITIGGVAGDQTIRVWSGDGADVFLVTDVQAGGSVILYGEGEADTVTLSEGNLSMIAGTVHFDGSFGSDTITIDDSAAPKGRTITYDTVPIAVTGTNGFGSLTHTILVEDVRILGSDYDDEFRVEKLDHRTDLELFGNGGNDTFVIADSLGTLDAVQGAIVIHGGSTTSPNPKKTELSATDVLIINDDNQKTFADFEIDGNSAIGTVEKEGFELVHDGIEEAELRLGSIGNNVLVHVVPLTTHLTILGGANDDRVELSPTDENLGSVLGTVEFVGGADDFSKTLKGDQLILHDRDHVSAGAYTLSAGHASRSGWLGVDFSELETVQLNTSIQGSTTTIASTSPGTTYFVLGHMGNDDLIVSGMSSYVLFQGNAGIDTAKVVGTSLADTFTVAGDTIWYQTGWLTTLSSVEHRIIDGGARQDFLIVEGVEGVSEQFRIRPTTTAYSGIVDIGSLAPVQYVNLEEMEVNGNDGEADTLRVDGRRHAWLNGATNYADVFDINLTANGTYQDPLAILRDSNGKQFLRLRDFGGLSDVEFNGLGGVDTLNILVAPEPADLGRAIRVVGGGAPANSFGDRLNVTYTASGASMDWEPEAADEGTIEFLYSVNLFEIDYDGFGADQIDLNAV